MSDEPITPEVVDAPPEQAPAAEPVVRAEASKHVTRYEAGGIQLASMGDALAWADAVIRSAFAPRGFNRASQVIVAAQMGHELGLGPAASLRAIYVPPSGRPSLLAEMAHALCVKSGLLTDWKHELSGAGDARACTYYVHRRGVGWRSVTFSIAEAKAAAIVKADSGWQKYPDRMLLARTKSWALHDNFADVLLGIPIEGDGVDEPPPAASAPAASPDAAPRVPPAGADPLLEPPFSSHADADAALAGDDEAA